MVIQRSDRVAEVLRRDEGLIDTLIAISPAFKGLRNPITRRTMARLTTVEQAARVAGIDPDLLTERLNHALSGGSGSPPAPDDDPYEPDPAAGKAMSSMPSDAPPALADIAPERVLDLDVREDLRNGREPFSRIMEARQALPPGGVLRLRAIFEPVPLYAVLAKQGFTHWTEQFAPDDWCVWFYPEKHAEEQVRDAPGGLVGRAPLEAGKAEVEDDVIVIDVRNLEPPEPMVHTLAALETLPPGKTLLQINERVPQFLLPKLEELGFSYEIRKQNDALVRVFIRRRVD